MRVRTDAPAKPAHPLGGIASDAAGSQRFRACPCRRDLDAGQDGCAGEAGTSSGRHRERRRWTQAISRAPLFPANAYRSTPNAMLTVVRHSLMRSFSTTALIVTTSAPVIPRSVFAASCTAASAALAKLSGDEPMIVITFAISA